MTVMNNFCSSTSLSQFLKDPDIGNMKIENIFTYGTPQIQKIVHLNGSYGVSIPIAKVNKNLGLKSFWAKNPKITAKKLD